MDAITGVISSNRVMWENVDTEICMECEEFTRKFDNGICPDCETETLEETDESSYFKVCSNCQGEFDIDTFECSDHEKLIGDWTIIIDKDGSVKYEVDKSGEFAAIVTSSTFNCVQVVWSKHTASVNSMCSPCFPGQADLDSGDGEIVCYTLPDYLIYKENEE